MSISPLHERLQAVVGGRTFRHIGELTSTHHETVRRYIQGQAPSVEFLSAVCVAFGVSADWLLSGRGPMRASEIRESALRDSGAPDLLAALADAVEQIVERVERMERFVQTMETRLRARAGEPGGGSHGRGASPALQVSESVRHIADAVAQRSRADDD